MIILEPCGDRFLISEVLGTKEYEMCFSPTIEDATDKFLRFVAQRAHGRETNHTFRHRYYPFIKKAGKNECGYDYGVDALHTPVECPPDRG